MNRLYKDSNSNVLLLKYERTGNYETDYAVDSILSSAEFEFDDKKQLWVFAKTADEIVLRNVIKEVSEYLRHELRLQLELDEFCKQKLESEQSVVQAFAKACETGFRIKSARNNAELKLPPFFKRSLMPYQKQSVEHIIDVGNAANFSVPGSGKTTIAYAAISSWINDGIIDKIMVIGPTPSFGPWEDEFVECFGRKPKKIRLNRQIANELETIGSAYELFISGYQLMANYAYQIDRFLRRFKVALIIDESHNIKNPQGGVWASNALRISQHATRRLILSGTPMPNDHRDLWTQITFLWPYNEPLGKQLGYNDYVRSHGLGRYQETISALFCRIKKKDLDLPPPQWHEKIVPLNKYQRRIYDIIAAKTLQELNDYHEQATIQQFRMAKMIRLLQAASNPSLLFELAHEFEVGYPIELDKITDKEVRQEGIIDLIRNYSTYEIPSKLVEATTKAKELLGKGEKVIIWTSFLNNIDVLQNQLLRSTDPIVIDGRVTKDPEIEDNREERIREFKNDTKARVLIATPPSLGEAVSLHKNERGEAVCKHAIYIDRNFNAGQYMQSMDRIHRLGMKADTLVHYWLFIGQDTIDEDINSRLNDKKNAMYDALNDDFAILDFNVTAEKMKPDEFEKDYLAVLEHLQWQKRKIDASKA